jgi:hypothetical protein
MSTVPATNIKFSNIASAMGGPSTNIILSRYAQFTSPYYTLGVSGVPGSGAINVNAFASKSRALTPNLIYRVYHRQYTFTMAGGGGNYYSDGGGGGGGVNVYSHGNLVGVVGGPSNAGGNYIGWPGGGFGAGGPGGGSVPDGGGGYIAQAGGRGGNGFVYVKIGGYEYFYTSNTTLTFPIGGTATIILMGGGGGGGYSAYNQMVRGGYYQYHGGCYVGSGYYTYVGPQYQFWAGGAGGGAGYLNIVYPGVSGGNTASIVIGSGGGNSQNGGTTTVTINGTTYSAGGGYNGHDYLGGAPGSSYGGSGSYYYNAWGGGNGGSGGSATDAGSIVNPITALNYESSDAANFNGRSYSYNGTTSDLSSIGGSTGSVIANNISYNFGIELIGYFYAPLAGTYTFSTTSVNSSAIWLGSSAYSGYTNSNRLVNNTGNHGSTKVSNTYSLAANSITAIYIQYTTSSGSYGLAVSFSATSGGSTIISETSNFSNYVFYSLGTNATYPTR